MKQFQVIEKLEFQSFFYSSLQRNHQMARVIQNIRRIFHYSSVLSDVEHKKSTPITKKMEILFLRIFKIKNKLLSMEQKISFAVFHLRIGHWGFRHLFLVSLNYSLVR